MIEYSGTKILIWFLALPALLASIGTAIFMITSATHDEYPRALSSVTVAAIGMFVLFLPSLFVATVGFVSSRKIKKLLQQ